ncbi:MAG: YceI family protein [Candidatus Hydrogenedentes bacterium]|nr:YceI family protein [Candidatus Hydrogenedentota bacterium]
MKHVSCLALAALALVPLTLTGCADPSENTPDAQVAESTTSAAAPAAPAEGTAYNFTPATKIEFEGSKVTGSHKGGFTTFTGSVTVPGEDLTKASITATIDMKSTFSDSDGLTKHLLSADFFEVDKFPEAKFVSTAIAANGDKYNVTGDFTLHGVTKSITFPAMLSLADGKVTAHAEFDINRMDFGIKYPGKVDDAIRENVVIRLHIEAAA